MTSPIPDLASEDAPDALRDVLERIARVVAGLARQIARGDGGESLDRVADQAFRAALSGSAVRFHASTARDGVAEVTPDGGLALVIEPLNGASGIEGGMPAGTIFGLYPAADSPDASILRPGAEMVAAGYALYGPRCWLGLGFGGPAMTWALDPQTGRFVRVAGGARVPAQSDDIAIDGSNHRHWPAPVRTYIDDCLAGAEGPRGRAFDLRWTGSLVAEAHRILTRGGIFLDPGEAGTRPGRDRGQRMAHVCAPVAFLIAGAGGAATDGRDPILAHRPPSLHARSAFVFGSTEPVARVAAYHDLPAPQRAALFAERGLFRT